VRRARRYWPASSLTATVVAIDYGTRTVTLKGGGGRIVDVVVPPEAKKLDQIKVGDLVTVEYARAVSLTLKKAGDGIRESTAQSATAGAPAGAGGGGAAANQVTILANVTAVNKKEGFVTLRGPKGNSVDLAVPDPGQLKLVKVGDQVEVVYTVADHRDAAAAGEESAWRRRSAAPLAVPVISAGCADCVYSQYAQISGHGRTRRFDAADADAAQRAGHGLGPCAPIREHAHDRLRRRLGYAGPACA
jgi:hypothetical protein